jgi:hypothetical protein
MAYKNFQETLTFKAASDMAADQFKIVELTANAHEVDLAAVGDLPIGVVQNHPLAGEAATVALSGITKVVAGGAVSAGKKVSAAATGFATQTISGGIEIAYFGKALTTAASGSLFTMLIAPSVTVSGDAN